jgi:hypothetical protein
MKIESSGIWCRVAPQLATNVSEECSASIFTAGNYLNIYQIARRRISEKNFYQASNKMEKINYSMNSCYNSAQIITIIAPINQNTKD